MTMNNLDQCQGYQKFFIIDFNELALIGKFYKANFEAI